MRISMACLLGLMATQGFAAEIALCPGNSASASDQRFTHAFNLYSSHGLPMRIMAHEGSASPPDCEVLDIPVPADRIAWMGPAQLAPGSPVREAVTLQGKFDAVDTDTPVISEVIWHGGKEPVPAWQPFGNNLLQTLTPVVFGREGRARFEHDTLSCEAGSAPAGVLLHAGRRWPASRPLQFAMTYTIESPIESHGAVSGERVAFEVAVSDSAGLRTQTPTHLGHAEPGHDRETVRRAAFAIPANPVGWTAFTLVCPHAPAVLKLQSVEVMPIPAVTASPRSAWIWSPHRWRSNPESLWKLAELERLNELFLTVPVAPDGRVEDVPGLRDFVSESHRRGLRVHAVIGDPRDVLKESLPALLMRVNAYLEYNAMVPEPARIRSVQLDIEPYLLPGFPLAMAHWRSRYVRTIKAVHAKLEGRLELDLVLPVWWGTHPEWGPSFLEELDLSATMLTVMNYRTQPDAIRDGALPFLEWGQEHGRKVRMALETGSLPDEMRRTYRAAPRDNVATTAGAADAAAAQPARLWLFPNLSVPLLVLLKTPEAGLGGRPYVFSHEYTFPASHLTFGGDQARLHAVAETLLREWSAWSSFAGLALHGLDEVYLEGTFPK